MNANRIVNWMAIAAIVFGVMTVLGSAGFVDTSPKPSSLPDPVSTRPGEVHSDNKIGVDRSLEAGHAPTDAKKGRGPMAPSFFTTSSFYDFFNMLSMAGTSFAVKAFSVVVFTFPCELSANANAVCVSSLGHSPIVT